MVEAVKSEWGVTSRTGKLAVKLTNLDIFPAQGQVPQHWKHPALEKFRKAQNVVYDIFNNGLGNRGKQLKVLGIKRDDLALAVYRNGRCIYGDNWDQIEQVVEPAFTPIIEAAAKEQGLVE